VGDLRAELIDNFALNSNSFEKAHAIHSNISAAFLRKLKSEDLLNVKSELIFTISLAE
jgi:hypothetical protein